MGIFTEAQAAANLLKHLAAYIKEKKDHDPQLMELFSDLREKVWALYESDAALREKVGELEDKLNLRENVFFDQDIGAWFKGTPEDRKDGPFCAKCYTEKKELVPMSKFSSYNLGPLWLCPVCNSTITRSR